MAPMQGGFDASAVPPKQGGQSHPVGKKIPFVITRTSIDPNKDNTGGYLKVDFTSQFGVAIMRYNLWNQSEMAVKIAEGQLSALCHATGIFKIGYENDGGALVGGRGCMDVDQQIDKDGKPTQYTEITKVYDAQGNEPGKAPAQPQTLQQGNAGGWGAAPQNNPPAPAGNPGGWSQAAPPSGGGGTPSNPPWANK